MTTEWTKSGTKLTWVIQDPSTKAYFQPNSNGIFNFKGYNYIHVTRLLKAAARILHSAVMTMCSTHSLASIHLSRYPTLNNILLSAECNDVVNHQKMKAVLLLNEVIHACDMLIKKCHRWPLILSKLNCGCPNHPRSYTTIAFWFD